MNTIKELPDASSITESALATKLLCKSYSEFYSDRRLEVEFVERETHEDRLVPICFD